MMILILALDYRTFVRYSYPFYLISLILLVLVMVTGRSTSGSQRWLQLGFISFQPSELAKIALILAMTRFFTDKEMSRATACATWQYPFSWSGCRPCSSSSSRPGHGGLAPFNLHLHPDFCPGPFQNLGRPGDDGCRGHPPRVAFSQGLPEESSPHLHQPRPGPLKTGYHITQSKIAVGSGTLFGKGFLKEPRASFTSSPSSIRTSSSRCWPRSGDSWDVLSFSFFSCSSSPGGSRSRRPPKTVPERSWPSGLRHALLAGLHQCRNGGGNASVVGVPLPLVSYGGTALVTNLIGIALLMNISMRRFMLSP